MLGATVTWCNIDSMIHFEFSSKVSPSGHSSSSMVVDLTVTASSRKPPVFSIVSMITILALSDLGRTSNVTCISTLIHSHMVITTLVNINYSFYAHVYNYDYAHILYLRINSSSCLVNTVLHVYACG